MQCSLVTRCHSVELKIINRTYLGVKRWTVDALGADRMIALHFGLALTELGGHAVNAPILGAVLTLGRELVRGRRRRGGGGGGSRRGRHLDLNARRDDIEQIAVLNVEFAKRFVGAIQQVLWGGDCTTLTL